ncbi:MAG: hypothetical protein AAF828_11025 [Bacteroidota bacterium]
MAKNTEWIQLQEDIKPYRPQLIEAADTVINQEVSNYPVFLAYPGEEQTIGVGIPVFTAPTPRGRNWAVHVTTLEELVAKQIVQTEKVDHFLKVYKSTPNSICFLIFTEGEARFGFVPKV